ncbi:cupin domain-containing protein [Peptoniphilus sp. SGI.035]|uniref:cupin domain-containing protein n=1 Tax=Peptoniphilus sp. SGI.035 TaxID=3420564 RepID=UPI003D01A79A
MIDIKNIVKGETLKAEVLIPIKKAQTISKKINIGEDYSLILLSLYKGTDISGENYNEEKFYFLLDGKVKIGGKILKSNECIIFQKNLLFDIRAENNSYLLEITIYKKENDEMKNILKGEVIKLKDAISYVDGGISNLDIVSRNDLKIMLMAFDKGEGLNPHSAPGDALVIPLEGEATLTVDDKSYEVKVGDQLVFPKNINHSVKARTKYKMLLILAIE